MHVVEAKARVRKVNSGEGWGVCGGKLLPTELCEIRRHVLEKLFRPMKW